MLNAPQARDILLVLHVIVRENVATAAVGDEIEFLGARRIRGCFERGAAWVRDGSWWQAIHDIRIVWRWLVNFTPQNGTAQRPFASGQPVDDGGVSLKSHPACQPIDEHGGNPCTLL